MKAFSDKIIKLTYFKKFIGLIILVNAVKSLHEKCEEIYEKYKKSDIKSLIYRYFYSHNHLFLYTLCLRAYGGKIMPYKCPP